MIKLIATDMDGTFLDNQGAFDKIRFERVLSALETHDIRFVVASGNGMGRLLKIFEGFENRLIFVAENGSHLYQNGQTLYRKPLESSLIQETLNYLEDRVKDYCFMLSNDEWIYMAEGANQPFDHQLIIAKEQMEAFLSRIRYVPDLSDLLAQGSFYKMGMWIPEEQLGEVVTAFNRFFAGKLVAVTSGYGSIDILPEGIHKAWGLKRVLDHLNVNPSQVMAFGDSDNDKEMLELVGHSYAVENATERIKSVAKHQIASHDTGAVLTTIEAYLVAVEREKK
ncbi:Cof-type HAD-IIB family hydrolase [Streptococcus ovis]|uniref:Cof-type HAD-IIB family hydrolase n=1 Tax=Streptococcus ovis TaxID=82806 RepID=UPI00036B3A50|nr:Cof-type HAD-IIB family hydrolase [Streptococcus ovis]